MVGTSIEASAVSPYGIWKRPATGVLVRIFPCGGGIGVKVVKSSVRARIGKVFMCGAKKGSNGIFSGWLKHPESGGTYNGRARFINARKVELSGCIPNTILCLSEVWRRVR